VQNNTMVAFKTLVVLHRILQCSPPQAADLTRSSTLLASIVAAWSQAASDGHGTQAFHGIQVVIDYAQMLQSKLELMNKDSGCGYFTGNFCFSRSMAEPCDLLQALALLLSLAEKLMPLALELTQEQDWISPEQSPFGRLYLGAVPTLLDEAWQLLCAVSVFVRDLLWQVHAAAKFLCTREEPRQRQNPGPPWLELAMHLLQAQPRFVRFHSAMCDFVALCHQLRCAGYAELAPPYSIPAVPQALLNLFADFEELVKGHCAERGTPLTEAPKPTKIASSRSSSKSSEASKATGSTDNISTVSTAAGSTVAPETGGSTWYPSARVMDALRTVDSLQRSPLLAEEESTGEDPKDHGYDLLDSSSGEQPALVQEKLHTPVEPSSEVAEAAPGQCGNGGPTTPLLKASLIFEDPKLPSWAAAICRRHGEACTAKGAAPLFATPLWESKRVETSPPPRPKDVSPLANASMALEAARVQASPVPSNPFDLSPAELKRATTPTANANPPPCMGATTTSQRTFWPRSATPPTAGRRSPPPRGRSPVEEARVRVAGEPPPLSQAPLPVPAPTPTPRQDTSTPPCVAEWEEVCLEELIGTGSTAEVYRATWHGTDVAAKKLRSKGQLSTEFKREISVLLRLRHPNLVLFMGACTKAPQALIISEFCSGGTVFALLHQRRDLSLPWPQRLPIALDVAKGMNFLHRRQVVHRDLKSLNLLLACPIRGSDDVPGVKVSDFGLSRAFRPDAAQAVMTNGAGTYHWMAPEVLSGQGYDEKVDVYSYGICLFELITRRIPYEGSGLEPVSIAVAVSRGKRPDVAFIPEDTPADLRFTMKCCWAHRSSGRPGFDTILETLKLVKSTRLQNS